MRYFFLFFLLISLNKITFCQKVNGKYIQKATISKIDSTIYLIANIRLDHRIFGYIKPDTSSKKMILISVFTNDVKGNPYQCPYGSFYQTSEMDNMRIKYISKTGLYIKANIIIGDSIATSIYILRKWIEFEK